MSARVNALAAEVSVDARTWTFALDARAGTAGVKIDGQRYTLRAPSWREKRMLARFAHLGEAFVEDQMLRLCLGDTEAPPPAGPPREALVALARWLNAPGGNPGLPLDRQLLAGVTLQICAAMHAAPQVIDELDAADVELLWQAVRAQSPMFADSLPANRIVVKPDLDTAGAAASAAAPSAARPVREHEADALAVRAGGDDALRAAQLAVPTASQAVIKDPTAGIKVRARGAEMRGATPVTTSEPGTELPQAAPGAARFRVLFDERVDAAALRPAAGMRVATSAAAHQAADVLAPVSAGPVAPRRHGVSSQASEPGHGALAWRQPSGTNVDERGLNKAGRAPSPATTARARTAPSGVGFDHADDDAGDSRSALCAVEGGGQRAWPLASPQPPADRDAIFEELAARLAQAAAEQGIDVET